MTSIRARWVRFARCGVLISAAAWAGCGITLPGNLPIGDDEPGVVGSAGAGAAGRSGTGAAGFGHAGFRATGGTGAAGSGGVIWGGSGGVAGTGPIAQDRDRDSFDSTSDCNDLDPSIHPKSPDWCCDGVDTDCDGSDAQAGTACKCAPPGNRSDFDADGFTSATGDCNDRDPNFYPMNPQELCCDGWDNDCDGRDDPVFAICDCATDSDGDGWLNGPVGSEFDCDDSDARIHPGASEVCDDGVDNDCDGSYDWLDGCVRDDVDGDGFSYDFDCNDFDPRVNPGAWEVCDNRVDDDCDGSIDNRSACTHDQDGDGYPRGSDCDDYDPSVYPGAYEVCFDGRDRNCNGVVDYEDAACRGLDDADRDGYPIGLDCDDLLPQINPGMHEVCGDGQDNDCDGLVDPYPHCDGPQSDWDHDGYPSSKDCNDGDSSVFPGSPYEICCDGVDSNCDGLEGPVNTACTCTLPAAPGDADGDGFGVGFSQPGLADCNDQDATIYPGADEQCGDGKDNNCDTRVDGNDPLCRVYLE